MALGRRPREVQQELWIATREIARTPVHVFYGQLNELLSERNFDNYVETLCAPYYADAIGRPGIPPGVYFRMLFIDYFEGIGSDRGVAWRCADSLSLRKFLGIPLNENTPDHSSLGKVRSRLPLAVHEQVFAWVLALVDQHGLLKAKTVGVDATLIEANAAMKSIVRRDGGESWREYVTKLMRERGLVAEGATPTDEELRNFDKNRSDKRVSNEDWESPSDPDARIAKMKDGRTHLAYKAEHAVDLETEIVVAVQIEHADASDPQTIETSLVAAQMNLQRAGLEAEICEAVADKGYHKVETLERLSSWRVRTYIPERKQPRRVWRGKSLAERLAFHRNRRRMKGQRGRRLQRLRSERVERSFAHICDTGGARRMWLRGVEKVMKRYLLVAVAHNLGIVMRKLFGAGKPRQFRGICALCDVFVSILEPLGDLLSTRCSALRPSPAAAEFRRPSAGHHTFRMFVHKRACFSTGC